MEKKQTTNGRTQTLHLIFEHFRRLHRDAGCETKSAGEYRSSLSFDYLPIPEGASYLAAPENQRPYLVKQRHCKPKDCFVLEPVWSRQSPQLLVLSPEGRCLWINGELGPPVALLHEKDEVAFNELGPYVGHLTFFNRNCIDFVPDSVRGRTCPICRAKFTADTHVYVCPRCGQALHCEEQEKGAGRLECAHLCADCPNCQMPIRMHSGYTYLPEFLRTGST